MKKHALLLFVLSITSHGYAMLNLLSRQIAQLKPAMRLGECDNAYRSYNQSSMHRWFYEGRTDFLSMDVDDKPSMDEAFRKNMSLKNA